MLRTMNNQKHKMLRRLCFIKLTLLLLFICLVFACKQRLNKSNEKDANVEVSNVILKIKEQSQNHILVCAHRGFHKYAPENSLKSIQDAIDAHIDIVEVDLRTTKDSVIVLMHDDTIDRTTTGKGFVYDYTYDELMKVNLKIKDAITDYRIPTLEEILVLSKDKLILNLDIKSLNPVQLFRLLKKNNMEHQVFSFIWDKELISEITSIDSLYAVLPLSETHGEMERNLKSYYSPLQHLTEKSYTKTNMEWARNNGIQVFVNSLGNIDKAFINGNTVAIDSLIALKPNIIQTDYPKKLIQYLTINK